MSRTAPVLVMALTVMLTSRPAAAETPDYDAAMAQSVQLEQAGQLAAAADAILPVAQAYPQDFNVALRLGWLWFLLTDYARSVHWYQKAHELNPEHPDPILGLAWCSLRQGDTQEARKGFSRVLELRPKDPSATEGLLLIPSKTADFWADLVYLAFSQHPYRSQALGGSLGLTVLPLEHLRISAMYRGSSYFGAGSNGVPGNWSKQAFSQHEGFAGVGVLGSSWAVDLRYGYLSNDAGDLETTHLVGLMGHARVWGRWMWDVNYSRYEDGNVVRASLRWAVPLGDKLELVPGLSGQRMLEEWLGSASLGLGWNGESVLWSLGGRYGREQRAAFTDLWLAYNSDDRFTFGLWATMAFHLADSVLLGLTYEGRAIDLAQTRGRRGPWMNAFILNFGWTL